jgi:hypothetical protein
LWYDKADLVTLLNQEPELVTKRHRQIDEVIWRAISNELQLDDQGKIMS